MHLKTFSVDMIIVFFLSFREIVEWAAKSGIEYQCKTMETTKFNELTVRIGCPYLYLHQGNCEHLLVFSDIR